jgi:hypothetical protein
MDEAANRPCPSSARRGFISRQEIMATWADPFPLVNGIRAPFDWRSKVGYSGCYLPPCCLDTYSGAKLAQAPPPAPNQGDAHDKGILPISAQGPREVSPLRDNPDEKGSGPGNRISEVEEREDNVGRLLDELIADL